MLRSYRNLLHYILFNTFFLFAFILLAFTPLNAQDYFLEKTRISVDDGLLTNEISSVIEDRNGLIWIGTKKGLQRYNGTEFTTWTPSNSPDLFTGDMQLIEDDCGWIWIKGANEVVFMNPFTDQIISFEERFKFTPELNGILTTDELLDLLINGPIFQKTDSKKLYFSNKSDQICTFDSKNGFVVHQNEKFRNSVLSYIEQDGSFWIQHNPKTSVGKISHFNQALDEIESYTVPKHLFITNFLDYQKQKVIHMRSKSRINDFADGLYFMDKDGLTERIVPPKDNFIFVIRIDGKFWYRYENELIITNPETNEVLLTENMDRSTLSRHITIVDSRGIIWLSDNNGLLLAQLKPNNFKTYCSFKSENSKTFENAARGIAEMNDDLLINFEHSFTAAINKNSPNSPFKKLDNLNGYYPRAFCKNAEGFLMLGNTNAIIVYDEYLEPVEEFKFSSEEDRADIWAINQDENGQIWAGTYYNNSLYKVNPHNKLVPWKPNPGDIKFDKNTLVQNIIPNNKGNYWLCTNTGLYEFSWKQEKILSHYSPKTKGKFYLPASNFYCIHESSSNVVWIGTENGLIKLIPSDADEESFKYEVFDKTLGFPSNVIYAIYEDKHEKLWMSSDFGIISFDTESSSISTFDLADGIPQMEFNSLSHLQTNDGTIYFVGLNGVTSFHQDKFFQYEAEDYGLIITELDVFDGTKGELISKLSEVRSKNEFTINSSDRFFRLKFTSPFFENTNTISFGWKFEGIDQDWNFQKNSTLQFGMLPYGKNILKVKSINPNGGWSKKELSITINVTKPFYLRTGNILLILFLLVGITALLFRQRNIRLKREIAKAISQIKKDKEIIEYQTGELKKLDELKSRFFANVSHELRTPLSLMIGPVKTLLKKSQKAEDRKLLEFIRHYYDLFSIGQLLFFYNSNSWFIMSKISALNF